MKHYIYDLLATGKLKEFEQEFEETFEVKAICCLSKDQLHMRIVYADYLFQFVGAHTFTDYTIYAWHHPPFGFGNMPRSERTLNEKEVENFYLEFMRKTFKSYEEDYKSNQNRPPKEREDYIMSGSID